MESDERAFGWKPEFSVSLAAKLQMDLKRSMKEKNGPVRDTIRQIMAEYPKLTVPITLESGKKTTRPKTRDEITDADIIDIVRGLVKSEKTVLDVTATSTSAYFEILQTYLPKLAEPDEIEVWIRENIDLPALKSPMQAMRPIMDHFGKRADGGMVKAILTRMAASVKGERP